MVATFKCILCGGIWAPPTRKRPIACPLCESKNWDNRIESDSSIRHPALRVQVDALGGLIFTSRVEDIHRRHVRGRGAGNAFSSPGAWAQGLSHQYLTKLHHASTIPSPAV